MVKDAVLSNDNLSDDLLENLLLHSDIIRELFALIINRDKGDNESAMSAEYNLLTYLGNVR